MEMTGILDLWTLLVQGVFGNLLFAVIGIAVFYALICMMARMSLMLTSAILILFLMIMLIGSFGSIVAVIIFTFSAIYFFYAVIPWIRGWAG
jgi:hypothetical protein